MTVIPPDDRIDADRLRGLAGIAVVEQLEEAESTMDRARAIAEDPACSLPAVVVAHRQTRGRGRRGAAWWQAPGSLAASVVYETSMLGGGSASPAWSLACGVAAAEAIRALAASIDVRVRWPNDLEVSGRKLAGIIVEAVGGSRVVFGIGVNTTGSAADAPEAVRHRVATLPDLLGRPLPKAAVLEGLLERFAPLCRAIAERPMTLVERFAPLCALSGRSTTLYVGDRVVEGVCEGIAADGSLALRTARGREHFASGTLTPPGTEWRGGAAPS